MVEVRNGTIDPVALEEFPQAGVSFATVETASGRTARGLAMELALAADRIRGASALTASTAPVAASYRSFLRQLGMDPEAVECTADAVVRRRLVEGGLAPSFAVRDAAALVALELGVPLMAFSCGDSPREVSIIRSTESGALHAEGDLVVSVDGVPVCRLFGQAFPSREVTKGTRRSLLVAVRAPGVSELLCAAAIERCAELIGPA